MRIKNFTLAFLMGLFGLFSTNLFAQQDATINPADIRYWIGEGDNEVVFIVNWNNPDTALAWGYRFAAESVTVKDMMEAIAEADYRFSFDASPSPYGGYALNDIFYNDGVLSLGLTTPGWVMYLVNGETFWDTFDAKTVVNGDYVKWGDTYCGTLIDPVNYYYVWEHPVTAVYPLAQEAKIDASEILYWVGEGENEVIFAVNFADPEDACYAWGYRFAEESVSVKDMMEDIAEADHRFAFQFSPSTYGGYVLDDLTFEYNGKHYYLLGYNAMYNVNGSQSWLTFDAQMVAAGDFVKWGDYNVGTEIGFWFYVWETPVQPVSVYNAVAENSVAMLLYPNPATSYTMLEAGEMNNVTVTVSDLQGRVLNSFVVSQTNEPVRIETESYQAGMYFVTVSDGSSRQTVKLSVK